MYAQQQQQHHRGGGPHGDVTAATTTATAEQLQRDILASSYGAENHQTTAAYEEEKQSLRGRLLRQQQQQQQPQQQRQQQAEQIDRNVHNNPSSDVFWNPYQTPVSALPATSDPFSPENGYYLPETNAGYAPNDVQAQIHGALFPSAPAFDTPVVDTTDPTMLQPRGYDQQETYDWQLISNSVGLDDHQLGLPTTITDAQNLDIYNQSLDSTFLGHLQENGQGYHDFDQLAEQYLSTGQQYDHLLEPPSRGVQLYDSPVPEFEHPQEPQELEPIWSLQDAFQPTPESIKDYFSKTWAAVLPKKDIPPPGRDMQEERGGIWCKICRPSVFLDARDYRQHKEETHGIDFKTGHCYWPPIDVRPISGVVGLGYEGYCATCTLWIPLDMSKMDFNWFQHASKCQDQTVAPPNPQPPADPLARYISSSSEDEGASIADIDREYRRRARGTEFLQPSNHFANNSGSNPSEEGSSEIWSSGSSRSALTSNSNSNSSANSAMSQHSLESRRKKVLRLRKRRGARPSNQGPRVYECTFCISDFANFGDWRRHEEAVHLVLNKWVCAPEGQYKPGSRECVYCDEVHEEQANIPNRCNASYCHGKGPAERVFARKDHLKQHLKRMHGIHQWRPLFETWSKKAKGPRQSRCGFCDARFDDWNVRMQHIAWEFKNGQKMADWRGDWGLDSNWMAANKLGTVVLPQQREDHVSQLLKQGKEHKPAAKAKKPPAEAAAQKKGLQRKPRLTSLRDQAQQQPPPPPLPEQRQQYTPSSLHSDYPPGSLTTPPHQQQSPLQLQSYPAYGQSLKSQNPYPSPHHQYSTNTSPLSLNLVPSSSGSLIPSSSQERSSSQDSPLHERSSIQKSRSAGGIIGVAAPTSTGTSGGGGRNGGGVLGGKVASDSGITGTAAAAGGNGNGSFQCHFCSRFFTRQDNLRRHLKTHLVKT